MFWLGNIDKSAKTATFKMGAGCQNCNQKGYRGRMGVFELLEMNEAMMDALKVSDTVAFSKAAVANPSYAPLASVALSYAKMGFTTVDEVLRLVEMVADSEGANNTQEASTELDEQAGDDGTV